jgi:xanthine dehydrogenase YagS FAD-binding subunit
MLAESILVGLTPQLREAASFAGNITQRPRCIYFRESGFACNKKLAGSGCAAQTGVHFAHAILGNQHAVTCIAVHPSDLCTGLTALDAKIEISNIDGTERLVPITEFHVLPDANPTRETTLQRGDLITALIVPSQGSRAAAYVKGPEEGFAMASAAVRLTMHEDTITFARVVLGGVAHKPWPCPAAENALIGKSLNAGSFSLAADAAVVGIHTDYQTAFRGPLLRAVLIEALEQAASRIEVSV